MEVPSTSIIPAMWLVAMAYMLQGTSVLGEGKEYCWEWFNITCPASSVIVMKSARYGRMRLGRCLSRDYYTGCFGDVLTFMDRKCSGRNACEMSIPDNTLHSVQPCPDDLMAYLEADFHCVPVAAQHSASCQNQAGRTLKAPGGWISGSSGLLDKPSKCPWDIIVPAGQRINLTLLDFNTSPMHRKDSCHSNVHVKEGAKSFDYRVCSGEKREQTVYVSRTNVIQVYVSDISISAEEESGLFLLRYDAIDCPDPVAPVYGWVSRRGQRASMGCNHTGETFHLVCSKTTWVGHLARNCSPNSVILGDSEPLGTNQSFPYGLVVAIVIGVILGVVLGVLLLVGVLLVQRRSKAAQRAKKSPIYGSQPNSPRTEPEPRPAALVHTGHYGVAHVWELQQLKSTPDVLEPEIVDAAKRQRPLSDQSRTYDVAMKLRYPNATTGQIQQQPGLRTRDYTYDSGTGSMGDASTLYHDFDTRPSGPNNVTTFLGMECRECRGNEEEPHS